MSEKIFTAQNPAKLLLVDDHPMLRRGLADLLSLEHDVKVTGEASNGQEALDYLAKNTVDLIVLDHNMPILNGIETLKAVAIHRIGDLSIGDMAVWIGVVSHHRYPAFDACRWLLDAIKAEIPVWKQEFYPDSEPLWLSNNG